MSVQSLARVSGLAGKTFYDCVAEDRSIAAALGPHEIVRHYAEVASQLHFINTMKLTGSRVSGTQQNTTRLVFDDTIESSLRNCFSELLKLTRILASRHENKFAEYVFIIQNLSYLFQRYESSCPKDVKTRYEPTAKTPTNLSQTTTISEEETSLSFIKSLAEVAQIRTELDAAMELFIREDCRASPLARFFDFVRACEASLGASFFSSESGEPKDAQYTVPEVEMLAVVTTFEKSWIETTARTAASIKNCFTLRRTNDNESPKTDNAQGQTEEEADWGEETCSQVMQKFIQNLVESNKKVHKLANHFFPNHSVIQAKLVGSHALLHEVGKYVRRAPFL